jgi:hypothetical protein
VLTRNLRQSGEFMRFPGNAETLTARLAARLIVQHRNLHGGCGSTIGCANQSEPRFSFPDDLHARIETHVNGGV